MLPTRQWITDNHSFSIIFNKLCTHLKAIWSGLSLIFGRESQDWWCEHDCNIKMRFPSTAWPFPEGELPSQRRKLDWSFTVPALKINVARLSPINILLFMRIPFFYVLIPDFFSGQKLSSLFYIFWGLVLIAFLKRNTGFHLPLRFPKQYVRTQRLLSEFWGGTLPVCDYTSLCDASQHLSWPFLILAFPPEELRSPAPWWRWARGRSGLCTQGPAGKTSALLLAPVSMVGGGGGCITTGGWEEGWGTHQGGDPQVPRPSIVLNSHAFLPAALGQVRSRVPSWLLRVFLAPRDASRYPLTYYFCSGEWFSSYTECKYALSKFQMNWLNSNE